MILYSWEVPFDVSRLALYDLEYCDCGKVYFYVVVGSLRFKSPIYNLEDEALFAAKTGSITWNVNEVTKA